MFKRNTKSNVIFGAVSSAAIIIICGFFGDIYFKDSSYLRYLMLSLGIVVFVANMIKIRRFNQGE